MRTVKRKMVDSVSRYIRSSKRKSHSGGRHPLRPVGLVIGLVVSSLLSGWSMYPANALEESPTPSVSVEVTFQGLGVVANSSAPIRVGVDQAATVIVSVLETDPPGPAVLIDDPSMLLEIEHPPGPPTRFADWDQVSDTEYQADFTFADAGTWRFVALPDLVDRSRLPPGSTDVIVVIVEDPLVQATQGAGNLGLLVIGGLVLLMVALVSYFTRHKLPWDHRPKTPSVAHDTWWNSP